MKTKLLACVLVVLTNSTVWADQTQSVNRSVDVTISSDAKDLAVGYAAAFTQMTRGPITLVVGQGGERFVLEDVRSVKAHGAALSVEVGHGMLYLINAQDVVLITDGIVPKSLTGK